ncbi:MAG: hypothetical protein UT58_C0024G0009 [Microgenomates group bacterium GW2011_GWC1_39_7b]|uniref:DUF5666 domain-containing protein n=2 Tax=Candidatus Woeseibacteriota TaxID=1752722 RepID=A0A0G0UV14_9BACT|nr:MAG: hypothetical protein UT17_C0002G0121 [Candidatus Woesebacteria bacterium GW2011_GWB1_39_10]KKR26049.1 MAG: hypothetical protein UT58_C0024G0009 [Microgenomates group bacterium GW2011_GWC1_39_7b]KKR92528.1 MAG: hypothetical protein UU42_C0001G0132 [Candidatus Woesebacteria bacterium GW2011_GWA1_41_13b]
MTKFWQYRILTAVRRELIWAAGIGITFGLIIAFGVWRINSSIKPKELNEIQTPQPKTNSEFKITLNKPEQNDVVTEDLVTVSGITKPLTWITFSGENDDYIIESGTDGVLVQDVKLVPGVNQIKITAFDPEGNQSIEKVVIVYSSSFQVNSASPTSAQDSSDSSDIRLRVQEKVREALNKPKAYLGTVTDIADSTIQIKTSESQIKQISTDTIATTVVKTGTINKTVKLEDIAIGDFIVAMGYINSNSVLSAQRILIASPVTEPKIEAKLAKVIDLSKKTITAQTLNEGQNVTITPGAKTDMQTFILGKLASVKITGIVQGDLIIYITDSSTDTPVIRSVFVIQQPQN